MNLHISKDPGLASSEFVRHKNYWLEALHGEWVKGYFPYDIQHFERVEDQREEIVSSISGQLFQQLLQMGNGSDQRLYMVILAGVTVLLHRYTGHQDFVIGAPIFRQEVEGEFLNTVLALRHRLSDSMSFKDVLLQVRQTLTSAVENQNYPLKDVLHDLNLVWTREEFPLFDLTVILENIQEQRYIDYLQCNLGISFFRTEAEIQVRMEYNPARYKRESVERILSHLINLFGTMLGNVNLPLTDVEILLPEEKEQLLHQFNNTRKHVAGAQTIHQIFEMQALLRPESPAVYFGEQRMTYGELNQRANQLAHLLRKKGVGSDQIVGLMVERSLDMIVGMMGIFKAGGAYLPIATDYPLERVEYLLTDSGARLLLAQQDHLNGSAFDGEVINLKGLDLDALDHTQLQTDGRSHDLAYIIYTSGSTGKPKGVMIEHHSVVNRLRWMQSQYQLTEHDVILQKTPYTFDVSVWELFWWSMYGAKVCFLEQGGEKDPEAMVQAIERYQITTMHFVPSMLSIFLKHVEETACVARLKSLRQVFASGEALKAEQVAKFRQLLFAQQGTRLHNLYGPTEATVDVTYYDCFAREEQQMIPIGAPIDNIQIYIVDQRYRLQPIGVPGELCIAGVGLARGYLHRPELTHEKFVANPFVSGERMYRTGDLARWLPDGTIEFLGRMDQQVKIRGYRIEPGEVESQLVTHPQIREGVVHVWEDANGEKHLCAYLITDAEPSVAELRAFLAQRLPEYMIPAYFVRLEQLPLSANGKLDRAALPAPDANMLKGVPYQAPRDEWEARLVEIWREILQIEQIGIYDNFFELGGHSLRVAELTSRVFQEWSVEIPLKAIFDLMTIEKLADYIRRADPAMRGRIEAAEVSEYYPMSSAQKRMFILHQLMGPNTVYNLPLGLTIEGDLEIARMEDVLHQLIQRHESFRTSFGLRNEEGVQMIHPTVEFKLGFMEALESQIHQVMREFVKPFDLGQAPLLRGLLLKLGEKRHFLILDIHHIIFDGVSAGIMIDEFSRLYHGEALEPLRIQYKDYAVWQNQYLHSEEMKAQEQYWLSQFADDLPLLQLPCDFPRPSLQNFEGDGFDIELGEQLTAMLHQLAKETQTSLFMVLLSIYTLMLVKCSGQEDIVIGTPIAGRSHLDLSQLIGMFVNTLPLRMTVKRSMKYRAFLAEVRKIAMQGYANQDYQMEELVNRLKLERRSDHNPLFDVTFTMQNMNTHKLSENSTHGLVLKRDNFQNSTSKFDLALFGLEVEQGILLRFEYCKKIFKKETVANFAAYFTRIAEQVVENPERVIHDICILDEQKQSLIRHQIGEQNEQLKESFDLDFDF